MRLRRSALFISCPFLHLNSPFGPPLRNSWIRHWTDGWTLHHITLLYITKKGKVIINITKLPPIAAKFDLGFSGVCFWPIWGFHFLQWQHCSSSVATPRIFSLNLGFSDPTKGSGFFFTEA